MSFEANRLTGGDALRTRRVAASRHRSYDVTLTEGLVDARFEPLRARVDHRKAVIVTTPSVARLYARRAQQALGNSNGGLGLLVLDCSEQDKSLAQVRRICDFVGEHGLDRRGVLIGMGGGVCTDLVTMAASMIRRGIDYIRVPTTLMGQVDASIGIKGAVNYGRKKSFLGCFYPPHHVLIDPLFLNTLASGHISHGLAEVLKVAIVADAELFELVERYASKFVPQLTADPPWIVRRTVWWSVTRLLEDLEPNLHEDQTHERLADYGHTFSPLLESLSEYGLHHGDAVAIDMAFSAALAARLGWLDDRQRDRIVTVLRRVGLPVSSPLLTEEICRQALNEAALHRGGSPNLVLPVDIGRATFVRSLTELSSADLRQALAFVETHERRDAS